MILLSWILSFSAPFPLFGSRPTDDVVLTRRQNIVVPAPIVVSPSQYFEGNDGPWSTFTLQVGTPAQNVRVLASTAGSSTWVVLPEGCTANDPSNCPDLRGGQFITNASSTYEFDNFYELALEANLGNTASGAYGFDRVGLDWQGSGGPILDHQVVAGIATQDFYLGLFGLTPRPTNFTDFNDPQPSFMQSLQNRSLIPSLSWSYTAGARYMHDKVYGSLILGGYDISKSGSKNISVAFGTDISRDLTVELQSIAITTTPDTVNPPQALLSESIFTFIDSTVPHIWLPLDACQNFEQAFGLTWDPTTALYVVDETLHEMLLSQNASLTFTIRNQTSDGSSSLDIILPYASFDLELDYPIVENKTRYFPLKRAANDTQYTLGRTFLQEAYLTVDYERSQFFLSQRVFNPSATERIIPIPPLNTNTTSTPTPTATGSAKPLSTAAIAGISTTTALTLLAVLTLLLLYLRRRRRQRIHDNTPTTPTPLAFPPDPKQAADDYAKAELDATDTASPGHEVEATAVEYFKPGKWAAPEGVEMEGQLPSEMEGQLPSELEQPQTPQSQRQPRLVYEMMGEGTNLPELAGSVPRGDNGGGGGVTDQTQ